MKYCDNSSRKSLRFAILFSAALVTQSSYATVDLTYRVEGFSPRAHEWMDDHGVNELHKVALRNVKDYLPEREDIKRPGVKLIAQRLLPGKSVVSLVRYMILKPNPTARSTSPKKFFDGLIEGVPHTYAVVRNKLIFTETTSIPKQEKYIDRFSKHFLITNCSKHVNYAGEFRVIKNKDTGEIFVIFDNASGTYKPKSEHLNNLKRLLDANFQEEGLYLLTKSYGQKIDREQLFVEKNIEPEVEQK